MRALILASILSAASFASPAFATINECPMKIDFTSADDVRAWRAVNDGVMGGLSSGGPDYEEDAMVFKGVINTNGGGFSSLRAGAQPGALSDATGMRMRVKTDGRQYKLTLRSDARYRGRSVSFQAPLPVTKPNEWEDITILFSDLKASVFGRPVRGAEFNKDEVGEIGIIIADGKDGPFEMKIDWMEKFCGR